MRRFIYIVAASLTALALGLWLGNRFALDTANREDHLASGRVGERQLASLRTALAGIAADVPIVVYMHHHMFQWVHSMRLWDSEALSAVLGGRANLLCFGHKHQSRVWGPGSKRSRETGIDLIVSSGQSTAPKRRSRPPKFPHVRLLTVQKPGVPSYKDLCL